MADYLGLGALRSDIGLATGERDVNGDDAAR